MIQKYGIRTDCGPGLMPAEVRPELWFLHYIALGEIDYALDELGIQWSGPVKHAVIPYRVDRMTWLESVQNIVQILSEAGV